MKPNLLALSAMGILIAGTALAEDAAITTHVDMSFDDASFALENAIVNQGLVVDYVSNVGEMLERTKGDVGGDKTIFKNATAYLFCSAVESRKAMEADPNNIVNCPFNVFVYENDDGVTMGYTNYPEGSMDAVEALLAKIVAEAASE